VLIIMCGEMIDARCSQDIKDVRSTEGGDVMKCRVILLQSVEI